MTTTSNLFHTGTDWNRHSGVGQTLLENWVEERAVGDRVLAERSDVATLNRNGHQGILRHTSAEIPINSTHRESHKEFTDADKNITKSGQRKQLIEAELMRQAIEETKDMPTEISTKEWVSTNKADFGHEDIYGKLSELGNERPSDEQLARFDRPLTFWSDAALRGQGTTISSLPQSECKRIRNSDQSISSLTSFFPNRQNELKQSAYHASAAGVSFGRHADFSTPIKEYLKQPIKDL
ncbi:hypothetical protein DFS34DRAFT_649727 [Phlyctochytrium arcticum]|nr:hypothetical protein DFS34DRAFT_649727 [Phlyctochytrium arcticum]